MRILTKWMVFAFIFLQIVAYPTEPKIIGWDYCTEEGHPFILIVFKLGFPIPGIIINQIWGCLSTPNQWVELSWPGIIGTSVFWITVFWILEFYWPYEGCLGEWEIECDQYPCSDKERCRKIASRRR